MLADPTPCRQTTPRPQPPLPAVEQAQGTGAGREYYTNLCMKAVNQSVGRAIRHIGDYATILLADGRFAKPAVRRRLPKWIGDQLRVSNSCDEAMGAVSAFFASRAPEQRRIEEARRAKLEGGECVD